MGPVIGLRPSGILNESNQVVGTGPPLSLTGPAPKEEAATARDRYMQALQWLKGFLDSVNTLEKDLVKIRIALRAGAIEIRDLRDWLKDLRHTRDIASTDNLRNNCDESIMERLAELRVVQLEQDEMLKAGLKRWDDTLGNLQAKIDDTAEFPEFQKALRALHKTLSQKQQLSQMELNLSAGNSDEFRRLATASQSDPALRMPVLLLRISDYIDRVEGRWALYAARLGMHEYPDAPAFAEFNRSLETSYLRMISSKAAGEGAGIHKAWTDYYSTVSESYIKQFFFGGLTRTLEWYAGRADALEQLHAVQTDRAVMEHNGLEIMSRLRDRGMTFDQIRALDSQELGQKMTELFNLTNPITDEAAKGMALAVRAAFANDDVQRLLKPNKEQFDVDMGRSYYGIEEFDQGFLEYAVDAINVKNAVLFMGPSAVLPAKSAGMLSRVASKLGAPEKVGRLLSTELEGGVAVREWLLARPTLQQAAQYLGTTRAGQAMARGMETLRYMRYDAPALVQFGTGVAEAAAQMVLFEAGGKMGHALGGDVGEFVGQALVMLAGNPVADLQAREVKAMQATAEQMAIARQKWEAMNQVLKNVRLPVNNATTKLASGRALAAGEIGALDDAIRGADDVIAQSERALAETVPAVLPDTVPARLPDTVPATPSTALLRGAEQEASALRGAAEAAKAGETRALDLANKVASDTRVATTAQAKTLAESEQALRAAAGHNRTLRYGEPVPPATGTARVTNDTWVAAADQTVVAEFRAATAATPKPPTPSATAAEAIGLGDDAMREGDFAAARAGYRTGVDGTIRELRGVRAKLATPNLPADEAARLADLEAKLKQQLSTDHGSWNEARQAIRYQAETQARNAAKATEMQRYAQEADKAAQKFGQADRAYLEAQAYNGPTVRPISGTAGGPREIRGPDGTVMGVWKPAAHPGGSGVAEMDANGQMVSELLFSRIAEKLGFRVPRAERLVLNELDAAGNVIARHAGVISRFVPDAQQLGQLTPGARAVLKEQIAEARALSILMGNYDVHFNNYLIDKAGRVWAFDAGLAVPKRPSFAAPNCISRVGQSANQDVQWARNLREFRSHKGDEFVRRIDDLMDPASMHRAGERIKGMTDSQLSSIIDDAMPGHPDAAEVFRSLKARRDNFTEILGDRWPPPPSGPGAWLIPLEQPGIRSVPWFRLKAA